MTKEEKLNLAVDMAFKAKRMYDEGFISFSPSLNRARCHMSDDEFIEYFGDSKDSVTIIDNGIFHEADITYHGVEFYALMTDEEYKKWEALSLNDIVDTLNTLTTDELLEVLDFLKKKYPTKCDSTQLFEDMED